MLIPLARLRNKIQGINPPPRLRRRVRGRENGGARPQLLNQLMSARPEAAWYLEIGVRRGSTLERVKAKHRVGVEPKPQFSIAKLPRGTRIYVGTSDEFFLGSESTQRFDLIFIDGLHTFENSRRDFINSYNRLSERGVVVLDDVWPQSVASSMPNPHEAEAKKKLFEDHEPGWQGDVWRTLAMVITDLPELSVAVVGKPGRAMAAVWGVPAREVDLGLGSEPAGAHNSYAEFEKQLRTLLIPREELISRYRDFLEAPLTES